jgi:hypothetical protein
MRSRLAKPHGDDADASFVPLDEAPFPVVHNESLTIGDLST